jgi:isoquinoline 1-oxidoreductase beta subunit
MLVQAAAKQWKVDPGTLSTAGGEVIDVASARRIGYGSLVSLAQSLPRPKDAPLKDPARFVLIGKPLKRLDTPDKVNGKVIYGVDVMLPGLKFATLASSPVFGGTVKNVDDSKAKEIPGVLQVVVLEQLVAVVGIHMWAAQKGLEALKITWGEGNNGHISTADILNKSRAASLKDGAAAKNTGDAIAALKQNEVFEAEYMLPFLAHAAMEPMNCTVQVTPSSCEVWVGTQILARAQSVAMKVTGLPADKVVFHNHLIGGGFGRRLDVDGIEKAVMIATKVEGPVKVLWTREEDIQHDIYRPLYVDRLAATVSDGRVVAWKHRITGSSIMARWFPPEFKKGVDTDGVDAAAQIPYEIENLHVEFQRDEPFAIPTGFWRGVGPNNNVFAVESFMDELAHRAQVDPVAFRLRHLRNAPRFVSVLNLAAEKAGWGSALPARAGRGVCLSGGFGSFTAVVVEAAVDLAGTVTVHRVVIAVDAGIIVNPDSVVAQMEGGAIFGLTAALHGQIDIEKGRVVQSNFHDYRMLRINEIPSIEVHVVQSAELPGGMGEAGTAAVPPALINALFAATGVRLRHLPVDRRALTGSKSS